MVTYMTDVRYQPDYGKCRSAEFGTTPPPAHTLLTISQLAWPGMIVENRRDGGRAGEVAASLLVPAKSPIVIASEAKHPDTLQQFWMLRRFAPRNDGGAEDTG